MVVVLVLQGAVYAKVSRDVSIIPGLFQDERQWHAVAVAVTLALTGAVFLLTRHLLSRSLLAARRAGGPTCAACGAEVRGGAGWLYRRRSWLAVVAAIVTLCVFAGYRGLFAWCVRDLGEFGVTQADESVARERRVLVHPPWRPDGLERMVEGWQQGLNNPLAYADSMNSRYAEFKRFLTVQEPWHLAATHGLFIFAHSVLVSGYAITLALVVPVMAVLPRQQDRRDPEASKGAQSVAVIGDVASEAGQSLTELATGFGDR